MKYSSCLFERFGDFIIGLLILGLGILLSVIGVTILPFIGVLMAIPLFVLAWKFLGAPLGSACSLS